MSHHHRCVPAPFLTKTYDLVEDPSNDDVISWGKIGCTFVVWKPVEFARDLLPKYFKHNNFSSFVRQLNTYGFRKIVPERWEFANEFFRQGDKKLLCEIHRRRTVLPVATTQIPVGRKSNGSPTPTLNSGGDLGSSSTSSPDLCPKNYVSDETTMTQFSELSDENEKLRKDNQQLSSELAQTKKHCEELLSFLSRYINVSPEEINSMMMQGGKGLNFDHLVRFFQEEEEEEEEEAEQEDDGEEGEDEEENDGDEGETQLKLFGVWLKGFESEKKEKKKKNTKRGHMDGSAVEAPLKKMKMDYQVARATKSAVDFVKCVS